MSDDWISSTTHSDTSLDPTPNRGRTTLDQNAKIKSRIHLPYTTAVSKGLSDGIDTPELASDGRSESTSSLDASTPTPNSSREAISEDAPTARHIIDSIEVNATGEHHKGPSDISEDMDEDMNTRCNGLLYSLQGGGKIVTVLAAAAGDGIVVVARHHARCFACAACQREFSEGRRVQLYLSNRISGLPTFRCVSNS